MHPINIKDNDETDITDIVFKDILSETTKKIRRNLLIISFLTFFIVLDEIIITKFFGIAFKDGISADKLSLLTESALSVILLYLMTTFAISLRIDHQQWHTAKNLTKVMNSWKHLNNIDYKLTDITHKIFLYEDQSSSDIKLTTNNPDYEVGPLDINNRHDLRKLICGLFYENVDGKEQLNHEAKKLKVSQTDVNKIFNEYKTLKSDHKFKYWIVDIGIPAVVAAIAFTKVSHGLIVFWSNL